jgi:hypothetical protein
MKAYNAGRSCEGLPQVPPLLGGAKRPAIFREGSVG